MCLVGWSNLLLLFSLRVSHVDHKLIKPCGTHTLTHTPSILPFWVSICPMIQPEPIDYDYDYIMAPQRGRPYGANLGSMGRNTGTWSIRSECLSNITSWTPCVLAGSCQHVVPVERPLHMTLITPSQGCLLGPGYSWSRGPRRHLVGTYVYVGTGVVCVL